MNEYEIRQHRERAIIILYGMIARINDMDIPLTITVDFAHDAIERTKPGATVGEWSPGNRSWSLTIKEDYTREFYDEIYNKNNPK